MQSVNETGGMYMAQHVSIRIPWYNNDYCGTVCKQPCHNNACMRFRNISAGKKTILRIALPFKW